MNKTIQHDERTGRYFVRWQENGVRKRFWLGTSQREAKEKLQSLVKGIAAGTVALTTTETTCRLGDSGKKDIRIEELAHRHLSWVKDNRSPATYELRRYCVKAFLEFTGPCMVSDVTRLKLSEFQAWVRKHHSAKPNGGNHHLREVRSMLRWAEDYDVCTNPVMRFPPIRTPTPQTLRFSDEEIARLLARIPQGAFRDLIVFGLLTGLRPQELRALKRSQLGQDSQGRGYVFIETHKTSRSSREPLARSVPLPDEAMAIVRRQMDAHPDGDHVFVCAAGRPYSAGVFRRRLERWCKRAGVEIKPPYALRHTFASLQAEGDVNIVVLGQLMGHTTTRTTARYIRASAEYHKQAVDRTGAHILALLPGEESIAPGGREMATKHIPGTCLCRACS